MTATPTPPDAPYLTALPEPIPPHPPLAGSTSSDSHHPGEALLAPWQNRQSALVGWGTGSYALGAAHDQGIASTNPDTGLPELRDGHYRFDRRLANAGDQALLDGTTALDLHPAPYLER